MAAGNLVKMPKAKVDNFPGKLDKSWMQALRSIELNVPMNAR